MNIRFLFVALVLSISHLHAADLWLTDFDEAKKKAAAEDKPLVLDFTGSDWCGWCIKLDQEVFEKAPFKEYAEKNLVLVKLDFPRRKELSKKLKKQNEKLAEQFKVKGYPTIIVLDSKAKQIGQTGYMAGGPDVFIAELNKIIAK
jgi:protein disulfide-isomerase